LGVYHSRRRPVANRILFSTFCGKFPKTLVHMILICHVDPLWTGIFGYIPH
jgi:hypothetical protein